MRRRLTTIIIVLLSANSSFGQSDIDSLNLALEKADHDSIKMFTYYELSRAISWTSPDSGIYYAKRSLDLAHKFSNISQVASCYSQMGFSYYKQDNIDSAAFYWDKAATIFVDINEHKKSALIWENIGQNLIFAGKYSEAQEYLDRAKDYYININSKSRYYILINYGLLNDIKGDYDKAFAYYMEAYDFLKSDNDIRRLGLCLSNMSAMFFYMGDCAKSIDYGRQALAYWEGESYKLDRQEVYQNMALCFEKTGQLDSSIYFTELAIAGAQDAKNKWAEGALYHNLGAMQLGLGNIDGSIVYLDKAISLKSGFNEREGTSLSHIELAKSLTKKGRYKESLESLLIGKVIAERVGILDEIKMYYKSSSEIYEDQSRYDLSLAAYKEFILLKDSTVSVETLAKIEDIKEKYESEKKQATIVSLKQEGNLLKKLSLIHISEPTRPY